LPSPTSSIKVTLYFPTSDATGLAPVERTITVANQEVIQALFTELNNPPSGLVKPLPDGTQLLDAKVNNGVATLSLSKSFKENFEGGATGEQMILYSIVNTLTAQADIQSVVFLLEGEKTVAILGELDTTAPIKRNESLVLKQ
jgi:spore germination protein GerM